MAEQQLKTRRPHKKIDKQLDDSDAATFSFTCSCGDVTMVTATNRREAIDKINAEMTEHGIESHFTDQHPGEPTPSVEEMQTRVQEELTSA